MTDDRNDNPRREHRQRVLKGASILTGIANSEIKCVIRNMHENENGAELRVPVDARIPEEFLLYVAVDGIAYRAVVRWRSNDRVGGHVYRNRAQTSLALRVIRRARRIGPDVPAN